MSKNTTESGWQRFLNWIKGNREKPGKTGADGSSQANETDQQPKAKQVNSWENEGGATPAPQFDIAQIRPALLGIVISRLTCVLVQSYAAGDDRKEEQK